MEIPKNTTQIGEIQGNRKIFIEDYVVSYIKQLCRQDADRKKRIAFYGVQRNEQEQEYFFIYGASQITIYGKNDYYLMESDYEEITNVGKKYFEEYVPLGIVTIEDELPEGIILLYGEKEKYIKGYHIFYEKNDSMLTFLINRQNEEKKENTDNDISSAHLLIEESVQETPIKKEPAPIRSREELLQKRNGDSFQPEIKLFGIVKSVATALLIVICVTAISTLNGFGKIESVQNYFQKAFREIKEKKIPDKEEVVFTNAEVEKKQIVDTYEEKSDTSVEVSTDKQEDVITDASSDIISGVSDNTAEVIDENKIENVSQEPRSYIVEEGETLISISRSIYGDDSKVKAICELNGITNSDNIQVGQKIILP